jgi:hypothetical protein
MLKCKYTRYGLKTLWYLLTIHSFLGVLSQYALSIEEKRDYWADYLLIPSSIMRNAITSNFITNSVPDDYMPTSDNAGKVYSQLHSISSGFNQKPLYIIGSLELLNISSLELRIGETIFGSPSFNSYRSPGLRLYSTSLDWQDPQYHEPFKLVLSVYRGRDMTKRRNIPAAMIIIYTENTPTRERTVIGYGRYGIYGTLTLLWEDSGSFPGTSFFQFGVARDTQTQFQPFYDPDLKEMTYLHQGQWIEAGWRISDFRSFQSVAKYLYYTLIARIRN